ncbi:MAG: DUF559 domain-containing protein [Myxococcota bacterium]
MTNGSLDPATVLHSHQVRRRTEPCVSVVCGPTARARAAWGRWCSEEGRRLVEVPDRSVAAACAAFGFAAIRCGGRPRVALVFGADANAVGDAANAAHAFAGQHPGVPAALIVAPDALSAFLGADPTSEMHRVLTAGIVMVPEDVKTEEASEGPLLRSVYERTLYQLLTVHPDTKSLSFETNVRIRGASDKPYEIDFFCRALRLAVEVDGKQHMTRRAQKARDEARDADLRGAAIDTLRLVAEDILVEPTKCLTAVNQALAQRRKDLNIDA